MLIPVVLSGGAGTRLWPVSRQSHPKPFMRLADGFSLLQKACARAHALEGVGEIITVTNRELYFKTRDEYRELSELDVPLSFVLETVGRNTAPAVAFSALVAQARHGADAVLLVLPADHLIHDHAAFQVAVDRAVAVAREGQLVTFGIRPTAPETGFGYIELDSNAPVGDGAFAVHRFVEKPTAERAREYVAGGNYVWNAGMFCCTAGAVLDELDRHAPELLQSVRACYVASRLATESTGVTVELSHEHLLAVQDISIDYALMERSTKVAVVPCEIGWSDIGSWGAVSELLSADDAGNRIDGHALVHEASGCYVQSRERVVGLVGVRDLVVVDTPDALLVADRGKVQAVKSIVGQLKNLGHEAYNLHRTVHRPWGTYTVLEDASRYKIKRIEVKPGAALSLQMHYHRSEHWIIVAGMARVVNGDSEMLVNTNESTYIPAGHKHRLENPGKVDLVMIEVQSGDYLGEDDIVRFEDVYGRA